MREAPLNNADRGEPGLLETCPFCGYSLATLPLEHRCPECGEPVDRRWRVFGGVRRLSASARALIVGLAIHLTFVFAGLFVAIAFKIGGASLSLRSPFAVLTALLAVVLVGAWWLYHRVPPGFLAIAEDGIKLCKKPPKVETIAWGDLVAVKHPPMQKYIAFETTRGVVRFSTFAFGLDYDLRMRCASAVWAAIRARQGTSGEPRVQTT